MTMKVTIAAVLSLLSVGVLASNATGSAQTPRVINVTSDSAPGWLPSEELDADANQVLQTYFQAFDRGNDRALWDLTSAGFKDVTSFAEFQAGNTKTRADLGRLKKLNVLKVTWTKDPAQAPRPGIYVAIDLAGQFTKAKRQCGYVVLFKAGSGDPFRLARIENNFMPDAIYRNIAKQKSPQEADRLWAKLSSNCPNYSPPNPTG